MKSVGYDTLYQEWLTAKKDKDYQRADDIRQLFERHHGFTIMAEGDCVIEGVTVHRMSAAKWYEKFGGEYGKKVAQAIRNNDSFSGVTSKISASDIEQLKGKGLI